jgi:SAM-dependent methyltransferase
MEEFFRPVYEQVFTATAVGGGTRLLDVGCGPGLAAHIAATRGALVAGLDAAEESLLIARERTPMGDFRAGDLESLPWSDVVFDVVTSFNAFQFAADLPTALREARRVIRPGGQVAMVVWGPDAECDTVATVAAVRALLPAPPRAMDSAPPFSVPGRMEDLLEQAGLVPQTSGVVECIFTYPDLETAVRGVRSAGVMVAAAQQVGEAAVRHAVEASLAAFRTRAGDYRQHNMFRYVIAAV